MELKQAVARRQWTAVHTFFHVLYGGRQVKDREGKWINVPLERDEVAVILGATAHHVSGGLLRPAAYRMVRSPGHSKQSAYKLRSTVRT